jgi:hypothetical protein
MIFNDSDLQKLYVVKVNWMHWGLWILDDTPDDGAGSAETYVGTENTKAV